MRALIVTIAVAAVAATAAFTSRLTEQAGPEPTTISPEELSRLIAAQPASAHFGLSGVAFFKDRLYASSNLGLMNVTGATVEHVYRWSGDSVIEGPWTDTVHDNLWVQQANSGQFLRFDGSRWVRVAMPPPPRGYYSRGDVLNGFKGVSSDKSFWMVGGGGVSRLEAENRWQLEPQPPMPRFAGVVGVAPVSSGLVFIVREETDIGFPQMHAVYEAGHQWRRTEIGTIKFGGVAAVGDTVFVVAAEGSLFAIKDGVVAAVATPGPCEAIVRTTAGRLLAAVRHKGVFEYADGRWVKKVEDPHDASEGEHLVFLAEGNGQVAYATMSVPHLADADNIKWTYTGTDALWVQRGQTFTRVDLK